MDVRARFDRCVAAMTPMTGAKVAGQTCAMAIYGSRGVNVRTRSSGTRRRTGRTHSTNSRSTNRRFTSRRSTMRRRQ